jgi:hypothetical protein
VSSTSFGFCSITSTFRSKSFDTEP